jgi:uncharacterized phage protein gp47/JayE
MDQAYRRAFIDVANGVALDNVVALLGIRRNPALKADGAVTFVRRATSGVVVIPSGTRVADESGRLFVTTADAQILEQIDEFGSHVNGVLRTANQVARVIGIWPRAASPEPGSSLRTVDTAANQPFGADERTITLHPNDRPAGDLRIRYAPRSVTAPVEAVEAGPEGNVEAGTIVVMPTPPPGVAGVVNERRVDGGQNAEPDAQLRERAKHALERAGNATLDALRFAILDVDGVEGVEVIDHAVDDRIPLGEVRVRFSAADASRVGETVRAVVDQTRAAGILARLEPITPVFIGGRFSLVPDATTPATAPAAFLAAVRQAIAALGIGEPLSVRRLNALVYTIPGLVEVAAARLRYRKDDPTRPGESLEGDVPDPFLIAQTEVVRPDPTTLTAVLLRELRVAATRGAGRAFEIDLQLVDDAEEPATLADFALDLSVALRARLLATPDQPPQHIGGFTRQVAFTGAPTAMLPIQPADLDGFRAGEHDPEVEVLIGVPAYPGLNGALTTIQLA